MVGPLWLREGEMLSNYQNFQKAAQRFYHYMMLLSFSPDHLGIISSLVKDDNKTWLTGDLLLYKTVNLFTMVSAVLILYVLLHEMEIFVIFDSADSNTLGLDWNI